MKTIAIATCTEHGGIGIESVFPWPQQYLEEDNYRSIIGEDNVVVVGKNAYIAHTQLHGTKTYVVTNDTTFEGSESVKAVRGEPAAILETIKEENPDKDIYIVGGESIFTAFNELIDEWFITVIEETHVYDKQILLARIKVAYPNHNKLTEGTDHNQNFSRWHFTK